MSDLEHKIPTRIKVSYSDKKGNALLSCAIEVSEHENVDQKLHELTGKLRDHVTTQLESQKVEQTVKETFNIPNSGDTGHGNCAKCGAPNKMSKAGKVYCSDICWNK
jgi:hypothetical protein